MRVLNTSVFLRWNFPAHFSGKLISSFSRVFVYKCLTTLDVSPLTSNFKFLQLTFVYFRGRLSRSFLSPYQPLVLAV